jgi:FkbM family methyltransferase
MNDYNTEWSLDNKKFNDRLIDVSKEFEIDNPDKIIFYSQQDEEKYVIQYLLKEKINDGVFLEVGACDGILYSNTKTLEDYFGFSGILIEPLPSFYQKLIKNRSNCEFYNYAVSDSKNEFTAFYDDGEKGGIVDTLNKEILREKKSILNLPYLKGFFKPSKSFQVKNIQMNEILRKSKYNYVDFMFIDVEGGELQLLKSIDFTYPIFCIVIEAHSDQKEKNELVREYLLEKGFNFKERQRGNEVWINPNYFRKELFQKIF